MRFTQLAPLTLLAACGLSHQAERSEEPHDAHVAVDSSDADTREPTVGLELVAGFGQTDRFSIPVRGEMLEVGTRATEIHFPSFSLRWDGVADEISGSLDGAPSARSLVRSSEISVRTSREGRLWFLLDGEAPRLDGAVLPGPHWVHRLGEESVVVRWPMGTRVGAADIDAAGDLWAVGVAPGDTRFDGVELGGADEDTLFVARVSPSSGVEAHAIGRAASPPTSAALLPDGDFLFSIGSSSGRTQVREHEIERSVLVRFDLADREVIELWPYQGSLTLLGNDRDDVAIVVSNIRDPMVLGSDSWEALTEFSPSYVLIPWDGRGPFIGERWAVPPETMRDGFWRGRIETIPATHIAGTASGGADAVWAVFDDGPERARVAFRAWNPAGQSAVRVRDSVLFSTMDPAELQLDGTPLDEGGDAESRLWLLEASASTGELQRARQLDDGPYTTGFPSLDDRFLVSRQTSDGSVSMELVPLVGEPWPVPTPMVSGVDCEMAARWTGPLSAMNDVVEILVRCETPGHALHTAEGAVEYASQASATFYRLVRE